MKVSPAEAAQILRQGQPLLFPTDTVFGLGVAVNTAKDTQELYRLKGRASDKPISWLVGTSTDLLRYGVQVPEYAHVLVDRFWPGALTLVVKASSAVSPSFVAADGTIGLRMPAHKPLCELILRVGSPLATTSANHSGDVAATSYDEIPAQLRASVAFCDLGTQSDQGLSCASTVIDCTQTAPRVLREEAITLADIQATLRH